ncbi:SHOCT domain-containing protein [Chloroflexota bacterium]
MMHYIDGTGWWMALGGLWMFLFWGGLIGLIVWGITKISRRDGSVIKLNPLDVAKERYARGEITGKDFEQIKKDLF